MTDDPHKPARSASRADRRKARLAEELRANLKKRKAQASARRLGEADPSTGDPSAGGPGNAGSGAREPEDTG